MNVAQMMNNRNQRQFDPRNIPLVSIQDQFRSLSENQINEAVQLARQQGLSEQQINEGLKMIQALKK